MKQVIGAQQLIENLARQGVQDFILCAGARNAPIVEVLSKAEGLDVFPFFDERAAAFFAVGRIQQSKRPVAVVTTSGTAAAELLPATIEAWYSCLPLVLITADRPTHFRGKGAPQSIEQVGLFSHYVHRQWDLKGAEGGDTEIPSEGPCHINVCFDEPLLDGELSSWQAKVGEFISSSPPLISKNKSLWQNFVNQVTQPVAIVGKLSETERPLVKQTLQRWQLPVYLEATSGLRQDKELSFFRIEAGEGFFFTQNFRRKFNGVIRLGAIPTTRLWRDLESSLRQWPVLSFSHQLFSGLGRAEQNPLPLSELENTWNTDFCISDKYQKWQESLACQLQKCIDKDPHSEPAIFSYLSRKIPKGSLIFLGNSLPIREWDLAASYKDRGHLFLSNRGANGIDGLISTFLGASQAYRENWLILGDLSTLYDLNAPWAVKMAKGKKLRLVVINNQGGKIFRRLFNQPLFENQHNLSFEPFADMWGMDYMRWRRVPDKVPELSDHVVIEIRPNEQATTKFWKTYLAQAEES